MKLRKRKLFSSMAFMLSLVMLMVSGAIFVHTATQQSATSSLQVTFDGQNVDFTAKGWYQREGDGSKSALLNSNGGDTVTFHATEPTATRTLEVSNTVASDVVMLDFDKTYVLFTYQFTNTATSGAFGMEVTLTLANISGQNLKAVKYGTATTVYSDLGDLYSGNSLSTFTTPVSGNMTIFNADFISAGNATKYYYILFELNSLDSGLTFAPSFNWSVRCSDSVTPPVQNYTVTINFTNISNGNICTAFEIWEDPNPEAYYSMGELYRPTDTDKKIEDLTSQINGGQITSGSSVSITTTAEIISILIFTNQTIYGDIEHITVSQYGLDVLDSRGGDATRGYSIRLSINKLSPTHSITFNTLLFHAVDL